MLINPQSSWQTQLERMLAHFARLGKCNTVRMFFFFLVKLSLSQQQLSARLPHTPMCDIQMAPKHLFCRNCLWPDTHKAEHFGLFQSIGQLDRNNLTALEWIHLFWQTRLNIKLLNFHRAHVYAWNQPSYERGAATYNLQSSNFFGFL